MSNTLLSFQVPFSAATTVRVPLLFLELQGFVDRIPSEQEPRTFSISSLICRYSISQFGIVKHHRKIAGFKVKPRTADERGDTRSRFLSPEAEY